jgi:hypothetical protein
MVIAIIIIPLELFVERYLTDVERPMIVAIQQSFGNRTALLEFMNVPLSLVRPDSTMYAM